MSKTRKTTKPQGTFSPDDVAALYLRLWQLSDEIKAGDARRIKLALCDVFGAIPNTTTNTGALARARNIRRKRVDVTEVISSFDALSDEEQISQLRALWSEAMPDV
jgi:hypothetical protein